MITTNKKVQLDLSEQDGNAYALMAAFNSEARRAGFTKEERDFILKDAMSGDYNHLVGTLMAYCE